MRHHIIVSIFLLPILINSKANAQQTRPHGAVADSAAMREKENLDVFSQWLKWNNPGSLLINHLTAQANLMYEKRDAEIKKLTTKEDWLQRQRTVKEKLSGIMGAFPAKTPLNARITGVVKKQGYRIEKILYEASPKYFVTGSIFIPEKLKGRAPAILNVMGHDQEGYKTELYQILISNLVKKGMIVLSIDPPGQGEHVQYYDTSLKFSSVGYSVIEHCYFGNQCFISGISPGKYFIWEGIRAIDYLISRKDVDAERIGLTGFSGGGTVTSYVGAFDERVKVAVPCSWSTASRRQLEFKGVQDAETVFVNGLAEGITFEDLLEVRAPKPMLMTATSRDQYLTLQGARESYKEAKRAYALFGKEDDIQLAEDDSRHWLTPKIREAIYAFFMKHFGINGNAAEEQLDILSETEMQALKVTPTGQISTSVGGNLIFDENKKITDQLVSRLEASRKNIRERLDEVARTAPKIAGYITPEDKNEEPVINGKYQRDGYTIGKYAINGEGKYAIPFLLFVPDDQRQKHSAVIYVHTRGKISAAAPGGEIEDLVRKGYIVAATDVLGIGETRHTAARALTDGYTGVLIGRSVPGIQAGDITRMVNYLKNRNDVDAAKIGGLAFNEMCIPMLHAAAFNTSIANVTLINAPVSYRDIALTRFFKIGLNKIEEGSLGHPQEVNFSWGIANILSAYDLPDLMGKIAPRKLAVVGSKNAALENASPALLDQDMAFPKAVYSSLHSAENLKIMNESGSFLSTVQWSFE